MHTCLSLHVATERRSTIARHRRACVQGCKRSLSARLAGMKQSRCRQSIVRPKMQSAQPGGCLRSQRAYRVQARIMLTELGVGPHAVTVSFVHQIAQTAPHSTMVRAGHVPLAQHDAGLMPTLNTFVSCSACVRTHDTCCSLLQRSFNWKLSPNGPHCQ